MTKFNAIAGNKILFMYLFLNSIIIKFIVSIGYIAHSSKESNLKHEY